MAGLTVVLNAAVRDLSGVVMQLNQAIYKQVLWKELVLLLGVVGFLTLSVELTRNRKWLSRSLVGLTSVFVFVYLTSWLMFASEEMFISPEGMKFFAVDLMANLRHIAEYSPRKMAVGLAAVIVSSAVIVTMWIRLRDRVPVRAAKSAVAGCAVFVGIFFVFFPFNNPPAIGKEVDPTLQAMYRTVISSLEKRESGPLSVIINGIRRDGELSFLPDTSIEAYFDHPSQEVAGEVPPSPESPPNVILLIVESLRAEVVGLERDGIEVAPSITRLAEQGIWCRTHYAQAPFSQMSDIAVISGIYPYITHGMHYYQVAPTWPRPRIYDSLARHGYTTAIISSQNERWGNMIHYLKSDHLDLLFHSENARDMSYIDERDGGFKDFSEARGAAGKLKDEFTLSVAKDFISREKQNPFFIYVNFQNTHFPYVMAEGYETVFSREDEVPTDVSFAKLSQDYLEPMYRRYLDSVRSVDQLVGELVAHLEAEGLAENTMIVVTGDTGQSFNEHGYTGHGGPLYEEVLRVPLIIYNSGQEPRKIDVPTQHVDIAPTITHLVGVEANDGFQGTSVIKRSADEPVFFFVHGPLANQVAGRLGSLKVVRNFDSEQTLVFDLAKDPGEHRPIPLSRESEPAAWNLAIQLDSWLQAQLSYYENEELHTTRFAPKIRVDGKED